MRVEQPVKEDLLKLQDDVAVISEELRKLGKTEKADAIESLMDEISHAVRNITDVCRFDRFAVQEYSDLQMKINEIVSAVEV